MLLRRETDEQVDNAVAFLHGKSPPQMSAAPAADDRQLTALLHSISAIIFLLPVKKIFL
jgi:hypothetical protein